MIIVLILISIIVSIIFLYREEDEFYFISIFVLLVKIGVLVYLLSQLINCNVIDEKIELYQTQNKEIESKVENVVKQYMEHEKGTFVELKNNESYMTLVTLYPELKSDELIKQEISLYEENNKKIVSLKEQKINKRIYKWWIYFGGK